MFVQIFARIFEELKEKDQYKVIFNPPNRIHTETKLLFNEDAKPYYFCTFTAQRAKMSTPVSRDWPWNFAHTRVLYVPGEPLTNVCSFVFSPEMWDLFRPKCPDSYKNTIKYLATEKKNVRYRFGVRQGHVGYLCANGRVYLSKNGVDIRHWMYFGAISLRYEYPIY